jgi:hypothetical protein
LLQHEDWGMMQTVAVVSNPSEADFVPNPPNFEWPQPTKKEMYDANLESASFPAYCNDPNPGPPSD